MLPLIHHSLLRGDRRPREDVGIHNIAAIAACVRRFRNTARFKRWPKAGDNDAKDGQIKCRFREIHGDHSPNTALPETL